MGSSAVKFLINDEVWVRGGKFYRKKVIWGSRVQVAIKPEENI